MPGPSVVLATQDGFVCLYWWKSFRPFHATEPGGIPMDFILDAERGFRLPTADHHCSSRTVETCSRDGGKRALPAPSSPGWSPNSAFGIGAYDATN
jgi:hypothetical protein